MMKYDDSRPRSRRSAEEVEMEYLRRDLNVVDRKANQLHKRVTKLEHKTNWIENFGSVLGRLAAIHWQTWAILLMIILGLTGHLTLNDVKIYAEAVKQ